MHSIAIVTVVLLVLIPGIYGFLPLARVSHRKLHRLSVVRPEDALDITTWGLGLNQQADYVTDAAKQASESFFYGFQARVIGTVFGNILAGIAFKVVADYASNAWREHQEKQVDQELSKEARAKRQFDMMLDSKNKPSISSPKIPNEAWFKLFVCVVIDAISDSSFVLPGVGELEDVVWAPLAALALRSLFQSDTVAYAEFAKEILPFTDIIPFATTVWLLENVFVDSPLAALLKIKTIKDKIAGK